MQFAKKKKKTGMQKEKFRIAKRMSKNSLYTVCVKMTFLHMVHAHGLML